MKNLYPFRRVFHAFFAWIIVLTASAKAPYTGRCGTINGPVTATATSVSGTLSSAVAATTVNLYLDGQLIGSTITSGISWGPIAVNSSSTNLLYPGGVLTIGIQESGMAETLCPSSALTVVCAQAPTAPVYTPSTATISQNQSVTFTVSNAIAGFYYTIEDSATGSSLSPTIIAQNNGTLTITSYTFSFPGQYRIIIRTSSIISTTQCSTASNSGTVIVNPLPLPLTLADFSGIKSGKSILLQWKTTMESRLNRFEVERSENGYTFHMLGQVSASGNSTMVKEYSYIDPAPDTRINYYRLKMIDADGKYSYSKLVVFTYGNTSGMMLNQVSPNPFRESFSISLVMERPETITVQMISATGNILSSRQVKAVAGNNTIGFNETWSVQSGLYFLRIRSSNGVIQERVIKGQ